MRINPVSGWEGERERESNHESSSHRYLGSMDLGLEERVYLVQSKRELLRSLIGEKGVAQGRQDPMRVHPQTSTVFAQRYFNKFYFSQTE